MTEPPPPTPSPKPPPASPTPPTTPAMVPPGAPTADPPARGERRWSALAPLVAAAFLPARTARTTTHLSLRVAYAIHWLGLLMACAAAFFVAAASESGGLPTADQWLGAVSSAMAEMERDLARHPLESSLIGVGAVLGVEGGTVLLAVLLSAWGACDEPLRDSLRWSLQRCWVYAPSLAVAILLVGTPPVILEAAEDAYHDAHFGSHGDWRYPSSIPFWLRYWRQLAVQWGFLCGLWWFGGLLAAVGAVRLHRRPTELNPLCDACGYNLTGIAMEGRCPECGQAAVLSLGPEARAGAPWLQRRSLGWWAAWRRTGELAMHAPPRLGGLLRVHEPRTDHRRYPALPLAVIFLLGWLMIPLAYAADTGKNPLDEEPELVWLVGPIVGWSAVIASLAIVVGSGTVAGLYVRWRTGRNLLPIAMQAACYASPWVVVWAAIGLVGVLCVFAAAPLLRHGTTASFVMPPLAVAASHLVCDLIYLWLIGRATFAARYSNR